MVGDNENLDSTELPRNRLSHNCEIYSGFINGTIISKNEPVQLIKVHNNKNKNYNRIRIDTLKSKRNKRNIFSCIMAVVILICPLGLFIIDFHNRSSEICIDGEFGDWDKQIAYLDSETDQLSNPSANIIELKLSAGNNNIFFFIKVYEKMFDRISPNTAKTDLSKIYSLYFFIDDDLDSETGYCVNGLGSDLMIKINGQNGRITKSSLSIFTDECSSNNWMGWDEVCKIPSSLGDNMIEVLLVQSFLTSSEFAVCTLLKDGFNNQDIFDYNIGSGEAAINVEITETFDNGKSNGLSKVVSGEVEIIGLDIFIAGESTKLTSIDFKVCSPGNNLLFGSMKLKMQWCDIDKGFNDFKEYYLKQVKFNTKSDGKPNNIIRMQYENNILLKGFQKYQLEIRYLRTDVDDNDEEVKLIFNKNSLKFSEGSSYYLNMNNEINFVLSSGSEGNKIVIDGFFDDWGTVDNNFDYDLKPLDNPNVDIENFKMCENEDSLSFFFSVDGVLLSGVVVPERLQNQYSDSIIKSKSSAKKPVSGDENGNAEPNELLKELLGEDKAYIFIDTDANAESGFTSSWMKIGADYCFEITGKNGKIIERNLMKYEYSNGTIWSWDFVKELKAASDFNRLETQVDTEDLEMKTNSMWSYVIYITDWNLNRDEASSTNFVSRANPVNLPDSLKNKLSQPDAVPGTRSIKIGNTTTYSATADNNQYKLVRNSNGIWFAFWQYGSMIYAANSTSSQGDVWNSEFVLIGTSGKAVDTSTSVSDVSVAIQRNSTTKVDKIHLVCKFTTDDILYTKLVDINDFKNSSGNAWNVANETKVGYELIDSTIGFSVQPPTIAVNSTGVAHVVWTQSFNPSNLYYTHSTGDRWTSPVLIIDASNETGFGISTIEVDTGDNLHLTWLNTSVGEIFYKRCLHNLDSTIPSNWKSANQTNNSDRILFASKNMSSPSMVADSDNNIWVVAHEMENYDIWYNKCTDKNWSTPERVASTDKLMNPSIGADIYGNVHVVWLNSTTNEIIYVYYTDRWSGNFTLIAGDGQVKYFPTIERHLCPNYNLSGIIYTNSTNKDISFEDAGNEIEIPEFSMPVQIIFVCVLTAVLNFTLRLLRRLRKYEFR